MHQRGFSTHQWSDVSLTRSISAAPPVTSAKRPASREHSTISLSADDIAGRLESPPSSITSHIPRLSNHVARELEAADDQSGGAENRAKDEKSRRRSVGAVDMQR